MVRAECIPHLVSKISSDLRRRHESWRELVRTRPIYQIADSAFNIG